MLQQFKPVLATLGAVTLIFSATKAHAAVDYFWDDGESDTAIGLVGLIQPMVPNAPLECVPQGSLVSDLMWLSDFDVKAGGEVIDSVSVAWGMPNAMQNPCAGQTAIDIGTALDGGPQFAKFFLYEQNADGTLNLINQAQTQVIPPAAPVFDPNDPLSGILSAIDPLVTVKFDQPKAVTTGKFFIGALFPQQLQGQFPAALDTDNPQGRSWLVYNFSENGYAPIDVNNLSNNAIPLQRYVDSQGNSRGNWLLRAHGVAQSQSVPESSTTVSVLAIGVLGMGALLKRRK